MKFLKPKGRIVIISYHSMEDRMVKHKFKDLKLNKELNVLTKKPLIPTEQEILDNKRSRSAKMRVGEKIGQKKKVNESTDCKKRKYKMDHYVCNDCYYDFLVFSCIYRNR